MISFVIACSMMIAVGGLFLMHTYLIACNFSTIEMSVLLTNNIYHFGWRLNME